MTNTRRNQPMDRLRIALDERWQIGYWTTALRCDERTLREAIAAVGPLVENVRRYLATLAS